MYNYPGAPGYNAPPGYGGAPGMAPPGMGPPGAAPPGVGAPPGAAMGQGPPALGGPRPLPQGWQPPANMPTFNFNAPVIRLGTQGGKPMESPVGGRRDNAGAPPARRGLGMDRDGDRRDGSQQVIPPSREEIARTIFVGNIPDGVGGDEGMERILETAGKLVRWTRATDANNKPQTFGFAEFADAQSLETAAEIFGDVQVPTKRQKPGEKKEDDEEVETTKLRVMVDDASIKYAEEWKERRNEDENTIQFRLDTAKEALAGVLASFFNPPNIPQMDYAGDTAMQDAPAQDGDVEVAFVNLATGEDELADIPAEMREIVAAEIAAFRDRSNQRDRERLRREEEIEAEERRRSGRRTSPPPSSAPTGPGGANGIPLGPRADRGVQGAPSGPKGSQFPRDYQGGVNFVNGGAVNGGVYVDREDDDDSASDSELERRRKKKRDDELDDAYQKQLSRWLKLESRTVSSLGRTSDRVKNQEAEQQAARDAEAKRLEEFDDDHEASTRRHIYYRDHGEYMREREKVRDREAKDDSFDRQQEQREQAAQNKQKEHARGQADAFLDQQAEEILRTQEPHEPAQQFKISLGGAAKKLEKTTAPRRTAADVEDLLEDEEPADQAGTKKRTLIPINYDAAVRANLTEEEVLEAQKQLARDIPSDKDGLWKWPVSWTHLPEKHIDKDIRVWTADKALQLTGVQDEDLVDVVVAHLRKKGGPQALVEDLEPVLDEEAESLVKKLWRMIIFFTETEKRGIK